MILSGSLLQHRFLIDSVRFFTRASISYLFMSLQRCHVHSMFSPFFRKHATQSHVPVHHQAAHCMNRVHRTSDCLQRFTGPNDSELKNVAGFFRRVSLGLTAARATNASELKNVAGVGRRGSLEHVIQVGRCPIAQNRTREASR